MRDEYDFSKAKRAKDIPHLAKHQQEANAKSRITIMLDNDVLSFFRERADSEGIGYQTLINATLRNAIGSRPQHRQPRRRFPRLCNYCRG